jgi:hypothetical protein
LARARGNPEWQTRRNAAGHTAERRPEYKPGAERGAEVSEAPGALFRRRHVRDIGIGGGDACRRNAGDHPADEQPDHVRRQRHQHIIQSDAEVGDQDHGSAAERVGQCALERREHELHERPGGAEQAEDLRRFLGVAAHEINDEFRQDRNDDADRKHVEQHRDKNEGEPGLRARRGFLIGFVERHIHGRRFRPA